jgi:rhamnose utilization protein RhaD (predicted bifunctional aldolase and dehydrogenase)
LHAICLKLPDINFVGHTHPTAINMITCSTLFDPAVSGRLFPDEVVVCGPNPVMVPYIDPGLPLAREIQQRIRIYVETNGEVPKTIYMQNHGFIALAATAQQVENITAMAVKAARILAGTYALGGPQFMTSEAVERIHTRPDEHYRQKIIGEIAGKD